MDGSVERYDHGSELFTTIICGSNGCGSLDEMELSVMALRRSYVVPELRAMVSRDSCPRRKLGTQGTRLGGSQCGLGDVSGRRWAMAARQERRGGEITRERECGQDPFKRNPHLNAKVHSKTLTTKKRRSNGSSEQARFGD